MKVVFRVFVMGTLLTVLLACNRNRLKVDISEIDKNIEIVRFDKELFNLPQNDTLSALVALRKKYPDFFDLFTYKVIRIGGIDDEQFPDLMTQFLTDTLIQHAKSLVDAEFSGFRNNWKTTK